eukprot:SAG22_NODE_74_length_22289_cov_65.265119_12_plen_353_part_00
MTQLLNTGLLVLLLRSAWATFVPGTHYPHVNAKWYAEIAAPLLWTVGLNYVTAPTIYLGLTLLPPFLRLFGKPRTQVSCKALPLPCVSTVFRSKTAPFHAVRLHSNTQNALNAVRVWGQAMPMCLSFPFTVVLASRALFAHCFCLFCGSAQRPQPRVVCCDRSGVCARRVRYGVRLRGDAGRRHGDADLRDRGAAGEATVLSFKGSDHCLSLCFSAFPCGSTALTEDRCNQLYAVSAVGLSLQYLSTKYLVLRFYKRPPLYSVDALSNTPYIMAGLLIIHAAFGTYFLSMAGGTNPIEPICVYADGADEATAECTNFNPLMPSAIPMFLIFVACLGTCMHACMHPSHACLLA